MSKVVSVNVGRPKDVAWNGGIIRSAIWKAPVEGRVWVHRTNIDGDGQADLVGHGGEQRAVLVYQLSSYRYWSAVLQRTLDEYGLFGENLTVEGLEDDIVCIGDRYRIGGAIFEVSQPRVTCFKVGVRLNRSDMPALLVAHGRPGFYMRVILEGEIGAGDEAVKISSDPSGLPVTQVDALLYKSSHPEALLRRAIALSALSPGWKASFEAMVDAIERGQTGGNAGLRPEADTAPAWPGFRSMRVTRVEPESDDVRSFLMTPTDAAPLAPAHPGQHVAVKVTLDATGASVTRLYSLSGSASSTHYRISVKRGAPGSASERIHSQLQEGSILQVSAPSGTFILEPGTRPIALLSAGIGSTPLIAMLHALAGDATREDTEVWWLHAARNGRHHAFASEAAALLSTIASARSFVMYSRPDASDRPGEQFDAQGHMSAETIMALGVPSETDFYVCGPAAFNAQLKEQLIASGVAAERIRVESFGADTGGKSSSRVAAHPPFDDDGQGPCVTFLRSGLSVRWSPRFKSVLELAEACDVDTRWSCRSGVCQTCQSSLLAGGVSYQPLPVAEPAPGTALICCSQPVSDLELDL